MVFVCSHCSICMETFQQDDDIYSTMCGHLFHHACMIDWKNGSTCCPQSCCNNAEAHKIFIALSDDATEKILHSSQGKPNADDEKLRVVESEENINTLNKQIMNSKKELKDLKLQFSESSLRYEDTILYLRNQIKTITKNHDEVKSKWTDSILSIKKLEIKVDNQVQDIEKLQQKRSRTHNNEIKTHLSDKVRWERQQNEALSKIEDLNKILEKERMDFSIMKKKFFDAKMHNIDLRQEIIKLKKVKNADAAFNTTTAKELDQTQSSSKPLSCQYEDSAEDDDDDDEFCKYSVDHINSLNDKIKNLKQKIKLQNERLSKSALHYKCIIENLEKQIKTLNTTVHELNEKLTESAHSIKLLSDDKRNESTDFHTVRTVKLQNEKLQEKLRNQRKENEKVNKIRNLEKIELSQAKKLYKALQELIVQLKNDTNLLDKQILKPNKESRDQKQQLLESLLLYEDVLQNLRKQIEILNTTEDDMQQRNKQLEIKILNQEHGINNLKKIRQRETLELKKLKNHCWEDLKTRMQNENTPVTTTTQTQNQNQSSNSKLHRTLSILYYPKENICKPYVTAIIALCKLLSLPQVTENDIKEVTLYQSKHLKDYVKLSIEFKSVSLLDLFLYKRFEAKNLTPMYFKKELQFINYLSNDKYNVASYAQWKFGQVEINDNKICLHKEFESKNDIDDFIKIIKK